MKPGGPFGFEALCGAQKPPDYPLLTTTTETSVNCEDCKRMTTPKQQVEQFEGLFTWYTVERLRTLETVPPWISGERVMKVADHERIVEHLKTTELSRRVENIAKMNRTGALSAAISEVEKMRAEWANEVRANREDDPEYATAVGCGVKFADNLIARLRSLSPEVGE
jgi:hypothetical protein